jgi:hypothetical protein
MVRKSTAIHKNNKYKIFKPNPLFFLKQQKHKKRLSQITRSYGITFYFRLSDFKTSNIRIQ